MDLQKDIVINFIKGVQSDLTFFEAVFVIRGNKTNITNGSSV